MSTCTELCGLRQTPAMAPTGAGAWANAPPAAERPTAAVSAAIEKRKLIKIPSAALQPDTAVVYQHDLKGGIRAPLAAVHPTRQPPGRLRPPPGHLRRGRVP